MSVRISLTKIERQQVEVMRQELTPWGLSSAVMMGGKHVKLRVWARDGSVHALTVACTPRSGQHALQHARQNAARLVRLINERAGY